MVKGCDIPRNGSEFDEYRIVSILTTLHNIRHIIACFVNPPFGACLLGHILERLLQVLLAKRKLANGPNLGILEEKFRSVRGLLHGIAEHTGLRFFLISVSKVPAFRAMISGAASGSCAMGEPQSEQKRRCTAWPEDPVPDHFLMGPLTVNLSLGTTATRAVGKVSNHGTALLSSNWGGWEPRRTPTVG